MVQLYIKGKEVDIDANTSINLTFQFEDLTNPTALRNTFSKTVSLPATSNNCQVFEHIWSMDHSIMNFDPSQRADFVLTKNGSVIEGGYVKLEEIKYSGQYPESFNISLYGQRGNVWFDLSEKYMEDLPVNFLYDHTIDRQTVYESFTGQSTPRNEFVRYVPTYSGTYANFSNDKVFVNYANGNNDILSIASSSNLVVALTLTGYLILNANGSADIYENFSTFPKNLSLGAGIIYDSTVGFIVWSGTRIYINSDPKQNAWASHYLGDYGEIIAMHVISGKTDFGTFAFLTVDGYMVSTSSLITLTNQTVLRLDDGLWSYAFKIKFTRWLDSSGNIHGLVGAGTKNSIYAFTDKGNNNYTIITNIPGVDTSGFTEITGVYATPDALKTPTTYQDYVYLLSAQPHGGSSRAYVCIKTSASNLSFVEVGSIPDVVIGGFTPIEDKGYLYAYGKDGNLYTVSTTRISILETNRERRYGFDDMVEGGDNYFILMHSTATREPAIGITPSPIVDFQAVIEVFDGFYFSLSTGELNEHQRNEFRSYYQRPALRLKHLIDYILASTGYEYDIRNSEFFNENNPYWEDTWVVLSRLDYEDEPPVDHIGNVRSGDSITYRQMFPKGISYLKFLFDFCKTFGLLFIVDKLTKQIFIQTRNEYFSNYRVFDWTDKLDYSHDLTIKPVPFEYRYGIFEYSDGGSYYEDLYTKKFNRQYGSTKVDTRLQFNNTETNFISDNIFTNVVMSTEYDIMFKDREPIGTLVVEDEYADDKLLPALFSKSDTQMEYNESTIHLVFIGSTLNQLSKPIRITDDNPKMLDIGLFMWNNVDADSIECDVLPNITRIYKNRSLDFSRPSRIHYKINKIGPIYPNGIAIYDRMHESYNKEILNSDNKIMTAYFDLNYIDIENFTFADFVKIGNNLWHPIKIYDYNVNDDRVTKVDLIRVKDINAYTSGQNL